MKSILVGLLATASSVLAVGCGCGSPTDFAPATLNASSVQAIRTPSACGVADPPYSVTDTFTLTIVGKDSVPTPYNTFTVTLRDTAASPARIPLVVPLPGTGTPPTTQTAASSGSDIAFSFARGSDATEVDDSFLSSVVVTVVDVPAADGELLGVTLDVTFSDGRELDETYSAKVATVQSVCAVAG